MDTSQGAHRWQKARAQDCTSHAGPGIVGRRRRARYLPGRIATTGRERVLCSFGIREEWLEKAQDGGFELAILEAARRLVLKSARRDLPEASADFRRQARLLAVEALRSRDPEVIFGIGELAHLFSGNGEFDLQSHWVWLLTACKRGFDCGQEAEWYRRYCRYDVNCQPYETGVDFIRRANPGTFDEIDRRSNDLSAKLDANDFDVFGSPENGPG